MKGLFDGIGAKISDSTDKYIGIRAVFGISYFVNSLSDSLELYGELAPYSICDCRCTVLHGFLSFCSALFGEPEHIC